MNYKTSPLLFLFGFLSEIYINLYIKPKPTVNHTIKPFGFVLQRTNKKKEEYVSVPTSRTDLNAFELIMDQDLQYLARHL